MDRLEDEMEAHAYEDLVPLEVKLALEDKVFGWTHLSSSFFGHVAFTMGAYYFVYELCSFLCENDLCFRVDRNPAYFDFLRVALGLWAAIATYRMVRRRRRVWFRAPYGSKAYKKDEARRQQSVRETDKSTALGRMMSQLKERRVLKRLRKAETLFAKKHARTVEHMRSLTAKVDERQPMSHAELQALDPTLSDDSTSSEDDFSPDESSITTNESSSTRKMPRRPSFHTGPTNRMESVAQDQIMFQTIQRMPYAHGGFFGAAPFMLANPHWISILRHLMPDVYVEISRRVAYSPAPRLIHWAENNPVVAAYGAAHTLEDSSHIPNLEWDVFLDPHLVARVQVVLDQKEKYLSSLATSGKAPITTAAKHILAYYDRELTRRSETLVDKMLIAHGNATQLVLEQTGWAKRYNYSRVKRTRRTLGGGIYARQWIAVFAEALKLGVRFEDLDTPLKAPAKRKQIHKTTSLLALAESKCPEMTMSESVKLVQSISKCDSPVGLVLDVKSRHVPKKIWSIVIDTLRMAGVRVKGIASFQIEEIRGVSHLCASPVEEIMFLHSAGDLQRACHEGKIEKGDKVFFNAGSLLWKPGEYRAIDLLTKHFDSEEAQARYKILPQCRRDGNFPGSTLEMYKRHYQLSIGVYCQEFAIDETAVDLIANFINDNTDLYDLGFSWGGVNGVTIKGISPGRFTSTDGFWNQRYIGEVWDPNLAPFAGMQRADEE
jgi:hypothetical protein